MRSGPVIWATLFSLAMAGIVVSLGRDSFKLRLLHTNDMHARFEQVSRSAGKCSEYEAAHGLCYGGFARVQAALKEHLERAKKENVSILSLNAGDTYQGTVWYTVYKWKVVSHFLKMLKIDAMALGNHEFDDGIKGLAPFLNDVGIQNLAANINFSGEPELANTSIKSYLIIEKGGKKIGIIGYLTPDTVMLANVGNLKFRNEIESLTEEASRLKKAGVDIIIALGHSGYEVDLKIAAEVPDLDVVVGGHSHTFLYTGQPPDSEKPVDKYPVMVTQKSGRKVAMVQAYAFTKYLGILDLTFDERGEILEAKGNPILLNHKVIEDPVVLREVDKWKSKLNATLKEGIGTTKVLLDASLCRFYECNLGNLITDAYIHHGVKSHTGPFWTKAAIAIQQAGGIRASINATATNDSIFNYSSSNLTVCVPEGFNKTRPKNDKDLDQTFDYMPKKAEEVTVTAKALAFFGPKSEDYGKITREDVITSMPFFSPLSVVRIKGKYLVEALEWSVARYDVDHQLGRGEFLQVSGLHVVFNVRRPRGSRITSLKIRCQYCQIPRFQSLNTEADYDIVMPTFLLKGGDNFTMFKKHGVEIEKYENSDTEIVIKYLQERGILYNGVEDRIEVNLMISLGFGTRPTLSYILFILLFKFLLIQ